MPEPTSGASTADWLEASKDLHILAYVPGLSQPTESATAHTAQTGNVARRLSSSTVLKKSPRRMREEEFEKQKEAFKNISPEILEPYAGRFVAVRNGQIIDSDDDLAVLTSRFFHEHGDVAVYIAKVGGSIQATIHTPLGK